MGYTTGTEWSDELAKSKILDVINAKGIKRMPTYSEIQDFYGNCSLTNRISRTYGVRGWAKMLKLPLTSCDTVTGFIGEDYATKILYDLGYSVEKMPTKYPYDLLINKTVKIDVKYSNLYHGINGIFYSFGLRKSSPTCDIYLLISNDDIGNKTVYIVPASAANKSQISIGEHKSMYSKYINWFDYINKTDAFMKSLKED